MDRRHYTAAAVIGGLLFALAMSRQPTAPPATAPATAPTPATPTPATATLTATANNSASLRLPSVAPANENENENATANENALRAAELAADQSTSAICAVDPPLTSARGYLAVGDHSEMNGRVVSAVLGRAYLPLLEGAGEGLLAIEGFAPTPVRWTDVDGDQAGGCSPDPVVLAPGGAGITGTVTHQGNGEPATKAWVEGCGAAGSGLLPGDLILEVDGEPAAEMDLGEFVDKATGREGTEVEMLVARGDQQHTVVIERKTF